MTRLLILALLVLSNLVGVVAGAPAEAGFRIEALAEGVYAVIRTDPPGLMVDANALLIVNENDVVVVDAPEASAEILVALRNLTDKPVTALINTHWHDDHIIGNEVWRDAFPQIEFIGHPLLREYLPGQGLANRQQMLSGAPAFAAQIRAQMEQGKNIAGQPINEEERLSYLSDARLLDHYLNVVPQAQIILPTRSADDLLVLERGKRRIEVRFLGRAHTSADLVVWLPRERILASGDIVADPVPLVGNEQSHVADWENTLARLIALRPRLVVPGHGPVQRELSYARRMQDLFATINAQVKKAVSAGADLAATRNSVNLSNWRRQFAAGSRVRDFSFGMYVSGPAVESAFRDAGGTVAPPAPISEEDLSPR